MALNLAASGGAANENKISLSPFASPATYTDSVLKFVDGNDALMPAHCAPVSVISGI